MDELAKTLKHFITRDILYLIGGTSVVCAFLHLFDRLPIWPLPNAFYLLAAGIGYGIGYVSQEILSLTPFTTTQYVTNPSWFPRWLHDHFSPNTRFAVPSKLDITLLDIEFREHATEQSMAEFQRTITLMQVGTTLGSSAVICAAMLCAKWLWKSDPFDAALAIATALAAIILLSLGWIKCLQHTMFLVKWFDWYLQNKPNQNAPHQAAANSDSQHNASTATKQNAQEKAGPK